MAQPPLPLRTPSSGGIAYDANIHNPPAKQGVGIMQQKLNQQRQLMRDRHRSASRNRLGASVVAQANPLAQPPVNRAPHWRSLSVDRPPSGGSKNRPLSGSGRGRRSPSEGPGPRTAETKQQDSDAGDASLGNNMFERISLRPKSSLDDISDCAGVEEIFDVCVQGSVPETEEHIPQPQPEVHQSLHGSSPRRPPLAGLPGAVGGETPRVNASPRERGASEAWGGAGGFQRAPSRRLGGDAVIESVADFGDNRPPRGKVGDDQEVMPFSARSKPRQASWDLDVRMKTPESIGEPDANVIVPNCGAAPPEAGGRRGRRWMRMFGSNGAGEQREQHAPASPSPAAEPRRRPPLQPPQQVQDEVAPFSMD